MAIFNSYVKLPEGNAKIGKIGDFIVEYHGKRIQLEKLNGR